MVVRNSTPFFLYTKHQMSCLSTPEQKGITESEHRHIVVLRLNLEAQ